MKLASLKEGRDGRLLVVSKDLSRCVSAAAVMPTLNFSSSAALPQKYKIVRFKNGTTFGDVVPRGLFGRE